MTLKQAQFSTGLSQVQMFSLFSSRLKSVIANLGCVVIHHSVSE